MPSTLIRTIFITVLAAGLFGLFLLVAPKLTGAGGSGVSTTIPSSTTTTASAVGTTVVTTAPTTTVPVTTSAPVSTTTLAIGWQPATQTVANGYDGSVMMEATYLAPDGALVTAGDPVSWQVRVTNTTAGDLWGVFAYVEGFGPAFCDARHIRAGESTDCWAEGLAYTGAGDVVAWVNAWTEIDQVKDIALIPFTVAP